MAVAMLGFDMLTQYRILGRAQHLRSNISQQLFGEILDPGASRIQPKKAE